MKNPFKYFLERNGKIESKESEKNESKESEKPKIETFRIIKELLVVNIERPDVYYFYESENEFGLTWEIYKNGIHIRQKTSYADKWETLGIFSLDKYSVVKHKWIDKKVIKNGDEYVSYVEPKVDCTVEVSSDKSTDGTV